MKDAQFKVLPGKELRVFPEDKDIPKDALNGKIDETFVKKAEVKLPEKGQFAEWKKGMLKELREKSFRGLPQQVPAAKLTRVPKENASRSGLSSESGIEISALLPSDREKRATVLVVSRDEVVNERKLRWLDASVIGDELVVPLLPRGVELDWTRKSPPNYVERSHALLGRTVDDGRVWDIIAAVRHLDAEAKGKMQLGVVARGQSGILAAYAALFEPSIKEVIIVDPPTSHRDGPTFLNVLRVLDIPEALGLLAPNVKLTIIGGKGKAFDRTAQLYKLAGAEEKFQRK